MQRGEATIVHLVLTVCIVVLCFSQSNHMKWVLDQKTEAQRSAVISETYRGEGSNA